MIKFSTFVLTLLINYIVFSQELKAVAAFQHPHYVGQGTDYYTYVPEEVDFQWAYYNGFNILHGNWPNDFFDDNNCSDIFNCGGSSPANDKNQFQYDLDLYMERANAYGFKIVFNLERFLNDCPDGDDDLLEPGECNEATTAVKQFINYVKNNPATYGYITFDEPTWRSDPDKGNKKEPISLQDQIDFYNIVKQVDPSHPVISTDPIGYCAPEAEPSSYCDKYMDNFSNGAAFDIFGLEIAWKYVESFDNTMIDQINEWYKNKFETFFNIYKPNYPIIRIFEAFNLFSELNSPGKMENYDVMSSSWRMLYKSGVWSNYCTDSLAIFGWSFPQDMFQRSSSATHYYYDSTSWYQMMQNSSDYLIGFRDNSQLKQAVEDFMSSYNSNIPWCPVCDDITISPQTLPDANYGEPYYFQLNASSTNQPFEWRITDGGLPYNLNLGKYDGTIYGIPQVSGIFEFEVTVMDEAYKSCIGRKNYRLISCPEDGLFIDVEDLWKGRVGENFSKTLNVYCGTPPFTTTIISGQMPPGINVSGLYFQGIPTESGYYSFKLEVEDSFGKKGQKDITFIVFDAGAELFIIPNEGTNAGGTKVKIYSYSGVFQSTTNVFFSVKDGSCINRTGSSPAESVRFISSYEIEATTPRHPEGCSDVVAGNYTLTNGYFFAALGFTSNQLTQDLSVINTVTDELLDTNPYLPGINSFSFDEPIVPMGMAFTKGDKPARKLLIVDYHSGNLKIADSSNFEIIDEVILQNPELLHYDPGAFDVAVSEDGKYAYIAHMTPGTGRFQVDPWNPSGSISVVWLGDNRASLIDVDSNPSTTSESAPWGITRIEPPADWKFVPLSIEDVFVSKQTMMYQVGDKWPGEYLFLSGVGPLEWEEIPPKRSPGQLCPRPRILLPMPIEVAVVDLNPHKVVGKRIENGVVILELGPNLMYRKFIKKITIGGDGEFPSDQGLSFYKFQEFRNVNAYIYAVNPTGNVAAIIDFNALDVLKDENGAPILIPTGNIPTDVKVQKVTLDTTPPQDVTYAYITNAGDDSVTVIDTATNMEIPESPIPQDWCNVLDHYPTSFDTRSEGDKGYSSDFNSSTVSVFDLPNSQMNLYTTCQINVGSGPIRIVIQPVNTLEDISGPIEKLLIYADPTSDFTEPPKQSILINDWEKVEELQKTNANPQAVLSNIENFQKNANKWIVNDEMKIKLNENVELYKSTYEAGDKK